jgi:hypothetical protein
MDGKGEHFPNIPAIEIDHQTAELFFDDSGTSFADSYKAIIEQRAPYSIELKSKAIIDIKAIYNSAVDVYNIIGFIEGRDASKKDEFILLTAHLDHVGSQCEVVFPGANDNATECSYSRIGKIFWNINLKTVLSLHCFTAEIKDFKCRILHQTCLKFK